MRVRCVVWILLALLSCTSCSSYEEQRKLEVALAESVDRFHEQLNNQQFHEIYSQADSSLQKGVDEGAFTNQLRSAHEQMGKITGKSIVLLTGDQLNKRYWARTFGREQRILHVDRPGNELIIATERFTWNVENEQPKLVSYDFRSICRKPCSVGFEIR